MPGAGSRIIPCCDWRQTRTSTTTSSVRGLIRRKPDVDIVRGQDVGLSGADDPAVLEWAAKQRRVLVTHDVSTLSKHAYERAAAGQRMPGIFEVGTNVSVARAIDDLLLVVECSLENGNSSGPSCTF